MRSVPGFFELIHFTECNLGAPYLHNGTMEIPVSGLITLEGHPLHAPGTALAGRLIFSGVVGSMRTVFEYIGDPRSSDGFKGPRKDGFGSIDEDASLGVRDFVIEGYQEEPPAWIDEWVVRAEAFELLVEEPR